MTVLLQLQAATTLTPTAGGTRYILNQPDHSADLVFTFDPLRAIPFWNGLPMYADNGEWTKHLGASLLAFSAPDRGRYYPTVTRTKRQPRATPSGNFLFEIVIVSGGSYVASVPCDSWNSYEALRLEYIGGNAVVTNDVVSGAGLWWGSSALAPSAPLTSLYAEQLCEYPRVHQLGTGPMLVSGYAPRSALIDHLFTGAVTPQPLAGPWSQAWSLVGTNPATASPFRKEGSSVLLVNYPGFENLVLRIGGENRLVTPNVAVGSVERFTTTSGAWADWKALSYAREHCNAVILPDASILVIGGNDGSTSVMVPELYRMGSGTWVQQPAPLTRREYHSTAVLLPDGRVLVAGGNNRHLPAPPNGPHDIDDWGWDYEIFSPHYLQGNPPPLRPTSLALTLQGGGSLPNDGHGTVILPRTTQLLITVDAMPDDVSLQKLVLLSPGSTTHHSDMHQRYVECAITTPITPNMLQFTVPTEPQAPNGYYMAFALTNAGIPSEATWVLLQ